MKKIIIILSICLVIVLTGCSALSMSNNQSEFSDGVITATFNEETGTLVFAGDGAVDNSFKWIQLGEKTKFVREIIFDKGITSIDSSEFSISRFSNLRSVIFKGDINAIGDCAFADNPNLTTVIFHGNCRSIGTLAFFRCCALEEINIPSGCKVYFDAFSRTPLEGTIDELTSESSTDDTTDYSTPTLPTPTYPHPKP